MVWEKLGSDTLVAPALTLDIISFTVKKFTEFLCQQVGTLAGSALWQFGGGGSVDTGNNYANRYNQNGGTDGTQASRSSIWAYQAGTDDDRFVMWYGINIAGDEKLFIGNSVTFNGAGSGVAPERCQSVGKWANTSVQYDTVKAFSSSGNMGTNSNLTGLGTD
tara:strand:+ start:195 stop:683 length:489 start_codon:yes stop_codon:yes gene_type:complete